MLAPPQLAVVHLQPDHGARGEAHQAGGGTAAPWQGGAPGYEMVQWQKSVIKSVSEW